MIRLLDKKTAVIFAAGRSTGAAVAGAFADQGARVFLSGRHLEDLGVAGRPGYSSLLKSSHHGGLSGPDILGPRALRAGLAIQPLPDPATAPLMLVYDGRSVGRGPAVAPFGQRDDHGFEVEPLFG